MVYCGVHEKHTFLDHLSLDILIKGHLSGDMILSEPSRCRQGLTAAIPGTGVKWAQARQME